MSFAGNLVGGKNILDRGTTQKHRIGTLAMGTDGKAYRYVKAGEAMAIGVAVKPVVGTTGTGTATYTGVLKTTAAVSPVIGVVQDVAFASGDYGWIQVSGLVLAAIVSSGAAPLDALRASATSGALEATAAADATNMKSCGYCISDTTSNTGDVLLQGLI